MFFSGGGQGASKNSDGKSGLLWPTSAANTSTDEVQLSNLSEQIRAQNSNSPERAAHLEKLSAAIDAGTYRVDSTEISRNIMILHIGDRMSSPMVSR